jgi:hypothetical protein
MRRQLRQIGNYVIGRLGSPIRDEETGELLGRALIVVWRGRIHLIGYSGAGPLRPVFCTQGRICYWRIAVGFTRSGPPDFPRHRPK